MKARNGNFDLHANPGGWSKALKEDSPIVGRIAELNHKHARCVQGVHIIMDELGVQRQPDSSRRVFAALPRKLLLRNVPVTIHQQTFEPIFVDEPDVSGVFTVGSWQRYSSNWTNRGTYYIREFKGFGQDDSERGPHDAQIYQKPFNDTPGNVHRLYVNREANYASATLQIDTFAHLLDIVALRAGISLPHGRE